MDQPMDYEGPELEIILRDQKTDNLKDVVEKVLNQMSGQNVGVFRKDKIDGDFNQQIMEVIEKKKYQQEDLKQFMDVVNETKIEDEVSNIKVASKFVEWSFSNIINEVEEIIDSEKDIKHSVISKKIEENLENDQIQNFLSKNKGVQPDFLEYSIPLLIQSGNNYQINKFSVSSDNNNLKSDTVYINICGKYKEMNCMASRTLIVNSSNQQKQVYTLLNDTLTLICKNLVVGQPIKNAYILARNNIQEKQAELLPKLYTNFGFGIGSSIKEDHLLINESNETIVKPNMVFHVRITVTDMIKEKKPIGIGDTIMINEDGYEILTKSIQRSYGEISYKLEDEQEAKQKKKQQKSKKEESESSEEDKQSYSENDEVDVQNQLNLIQSSRLRQKNFKQHVNTETRQKNQENLYDKKLKELKKRFEKNEIQGSQKIEKVKKMGQLQSYQSQKEFPQQLKPGQIFVDKNRDSILVPINERIFVPFHISTIKNVSTNIEGQYTYLRLNFHIPGSSNMQFPEINQQNPLFIKELTLKNQSKGGSSHLTSVFKSIKDLIKKQKVNEQEDQVKQDRNDDHQEDLITVKGKRDVLDNVVIRPNIIGKKTQGGLEIHQNGVRFASQKGHMIDITFSNIKHAFFQPCEQDELIVIIHFNLKSPIMVGQKKVQDVQFYKESGIMADDLDLRAARKKLNDMDELEQEERERQQKIKLNSKFNQFVKNIELVAEKSKHKLEFDIPFNQLSFYGCPHKSVVKVKPTKKCLMAISEHPFFVIEIDDIEIIYFERMQYGIKNFDMAILHKDLVTFKRINSIPIEHIEQIKNFLDATGIIFAEGVVPMNWTNILQQIRDDFQTFLDEGGWKFLIDDSESQKDGDEELGSQQEDPEFEEDNQEDEESESDYSDDSLSNESSDKSDDDELSEGVSWDEMEKLAEEDDRKAAIRRQNKDVPPVLKTKRNRK